MSGTLAELNPLRYRGYVYDQETGFYYLNSRYYDPAVGRFINPDAAIGQVGNIKGNNMFTYALNNPVMYSDLTGNWPKLSTVLAGVAAVAATVAVAAAVVLPVELQFRQLLLVEVLRLDYLLDRPLLPLQRPHWLWLGRQQLQVQPVMP